MGNSSTEHLYKDGEVLVVPCLTRYLLYQRGRVAVGPALPTTHVLDLVVVWYRVVKNTKTQTQNGDFMVGSWVLRFFHKSVQKGLSVSTESRLKTQKLKMDESASNTAVLLQ